MKLFVLCKFGTTEPFQLPAADAETVSHLMDHDDGVEGEYAFASTNKAHVRAMMHALPELCDWDAGQNELCIREFSPVVTGPMSEPIN
jgi:hypothetical protein